MVAKPLCPLYKNIIKPLDRARYPELRSNLQKYRSPHPLRSLHRLESSSKRETSLNNAGEKVVLSFPFLFLSVLFIPRTHQGTKFPTHEEEKI